MLERILVATDFSPPSDAAIAYGRALAGAFGASLDLLHVLVTASPQRGTTGGAQTAIERLEAMLTADDRPRGGAARVVAATDAAAEIVRRADDAAGLVVMGTHGRGAIARLVMGSVTETVVRTAPCPVLSVRRPPTGGVRFRRILVPTDFSAPSTAALDCARVLAGRFGASLHLLHVLSDVTVNALNAEIFMSEPPEARTLRLRAARERLERCLTGGDRAAFRATVDVVFGGSQAVIADYAADNGFDLIVMGTHGRAGMAHLLIGSVAERIVRSATCPVLTTRVAWIAEPALAGLPAERRSG